MPNFTGGFNFGLSNPNLFSNTPGGTFDFIKESMKSNPAGSMFSFGFDSGASSNFPGTFTDTSSFPSVFSGAGDNSSLFSGFTDFAGSGAFKNLTNLGFGAMNYSMAKKDLEQQQGIREEQHEAYKEDRQYNKERRDRLSQLRF